MKPVGDPRVAVGAAATTHRGAAADQVVGAAAAAVAAASIASERPAHSHRRTTPTHRPAAQEVVIATGTLLHTHNVSR